MADQDTEQEQGTEVPEDAQRAPGTDPMEDDGADVSQEPVADVDDATTDGEGVEA